MQPCLGQWASPSMIDLFAKPKGGNPTPDPSENSRSGDADLHQWFTPFWVAEELVNDALRGIGHASVLEPACGTGAFLTAIPRSMPAIGLDIDPRVVAAAVANSSRDVLVGDFRTHELGGFKPEVIITNPPFSMAVINSFFARAHALLPDDGLIAMVLPAYAFQTPSQVTRWMDNFAIDVSIIPRTLFPDLSKPLVWAKCTKTSVRRFTGMMLFAETRAIEQMRPAIRKALEGPGTWREAVAVALSSIGGEGTVSSIYEAMAPERRQTEHWRPKVRQTLQRGFRTVGPGRWSLPLKQAA